MPFRSLSACRAGIARSAGIARRLAPLLVLGLWIAGPGAAEIYRWVDAQGRVHYTHDLSKVPPAQRGAAEAGAKRKPSGVVQRYSAPPAARSRTAPSRVVRGGPGEKTVIRVSPGANTLRVTVRLNDEVSAPFLIDTGASHVVVPRAVVDELGLDLTGSRTAQYSTANGTITARLIVLESVSLGDARVEQVPAAVSDSMTVGLLGLSYFNRFQYQIDPAKGEVTLVRNDLEAEGLIRGGRSESDWRSQYRQLRDRIARVEERKARIPRSRSRTHDELDARREDLERELDALDAEADSARVPFAWRE